MSQGEVAQRLAWSLSKVLRIETGEVGVSGTDLRALLDVYGITERERIDQLLADARLSRRQRYVIDPAIRAHLSPGMRELVQFETRAARICVYQPVFYPGVLQTQTVAEDVLAFWGNFLSDNATRIRFEVRMSRRRRIIEQGDGPEYHLVLDESVIKRRIGSAQVTAEQLEDVARLSQLPKVRIRLVPFTRGGYLPALGPFQVLSFGDEANEDVLYRETAMGDELIHDDERVAFHRKLFGDLWEQALSEAATYRKMVAEAAALRSSLDDGELNS
jgi:hypothetical protein